MTIIIELVLEQLLTMLFGALSWIGIHWLIRKAVKPKPPQATEENNPDQQ